MQTVKCPKCGKDVPIREFGHGYVATCCCQVIYNRHNPKYDGVQYAIKTN